MAVLFVVAVAYYGTIAAYRANLDPDTYGIPVVSSSVGLRFQILHVLHRY